MFYKQISALMSGFALTMNKTEGVTYQGQHSPFNNIPEKQ